MENSAATASVPVNIDLSGSSNSQFTWNALSGTQVVALPIAGQAYEWQVKSYYDGSVSSGYATGSSFTMPLPTPLPNPVVSVSTTQTTANATWSWSGNTANATEIRIGIVKTDTYDAPTGTTILSDYSISKSLTSQQLDNLVYFIPGAFYRVNVRYVATSGYTDGSMAKPFTMASLSAPSSLSRTVSTSSVAFDWGNVTAANGYRLMVRKAGAAWPSVENSAATASVPVNIDLSGSSNSQFTWNALSGTQVVALPIAGQAYEWQVKSYYDGSVSSGYTTGSSFTMPLPPPLPTPVVSVSTTQTTANATWSWSGNTANATEIRIGIVKTDTYDAPTGTTILSDYSISKSLTSQQLDNLVYFIPGAFYRVNVRYVATSGYTDGSMAKPFTMASLSAPSSLSRTVSTSSVAFGWGNVTAANGYRLMVRKAGSAWPSVENSAATASVPVNIDLSGSSNSQFTWNALSGTQVVALPIAGQAYEWQVKSYYDGSVSSGYTTGSSFTMSANALPTIDAGYSASSTSGEVTVNFTPRDADDTQLRYDLQIWNAAGTTHITSVTGIQQTLASINGVVQSRTFTTSLINGALTNGTSYSVKITIFDPSFETNGTNFRAVFVPFTYTTTAPNPLGLDIVNLDGKKLGGLIHVPGVAESAPAGSTWKRFELRQGATVVAQAAGDFVTMNPDTGNLIWRRPNGSLAPRWTDILTGSGPFTLKVVGVAASGATLESAPFTFTVQNTVSINLTSSSVFPRYKSVSAPSASTINAVASGTSGTNTLTWSLNLGSPTNGNSSSISVVINNPGFNRILCVAKDTSGNRTVDGFDAPVAVRDSVGSAESVGSMDFQGVDVASGNFHLPAVDMMVPAIGVPFALGRSYNTDPTTVFAPTSIPDSGTWKFAFEQSLGHIHINARDFIDYTHPTVKIGQPDGSTIQFFPGSDGYYHSSTPGNHDMLVEDFNAGTFTLYQASTSPLVTVFEITDQNTRANSTYRLKSIKNLRGHGLTVNYTTSTGTKISTVTDQSGRAYTFYYTDADAPTKISRVSDFSGRNVYYNWDSNGNILTFTDVRGFVTTYGYGTSGNEAKRLQYVQLPEGNRPISNIAYDAARRVQSMTMPTATDSAGASTSGTTTFSYLSTRTDITRPLTGANIRYETDLDRNILAVIESYGVANRRTDFLRITPSDLAGQTSRTSDLGLTTRATTQNLTPTNITYVENGRGLVKQVSDGTGTTAVNYPSSVLNAPPGTLTQNLALPTSVTDKRGKSYTPAYTGYGELSSFLNPYLQGDRVTQYDTLTGLPKYSVTQRNNSTDYTTEFVYTATGDLWKVIVPPDPDNANREIVFGYPSGSANRGLPTTITDRKGYVTTIEWDDAGQPLKIWADPSLSLLSGERRDIVMAYDTNGSRTAVTNRRNQTTNIDFDAMGRPWRVRQASPDGSAARPTAIQEFDTLGRPTISTNPNGNRQRVVYGTSGNAGGLPQTQQVWNNSAWETVSTTAYLSDGRTQSVTDGVGISSTYSYKPDPRQHLVHRITQAAPGGFTTYREFEYDASENVVMSKLGSTDPSNTKPLPAQLLEYDDASRVRRVCDVMDGDTSAAAWSKSGNIITGVTYYGDDQIDTITDPRSKPVKHIYNSLGNLATRRDPLGSEWLYRYDANGNLRDEVFPGNGSYPSRTITRTWGVLDRLLSVNYGDGLNTNVTYTYDAEGNRRTLTDRQSSTTYAYDNLDRLIAMSHTPNGRSALSLGYSYLPAGQLQTMTYPGSRTVNYGYDYADRMKTVTPWVGGAFTYAWRTNGQIDSITNPNGTATDYQYESSNGRLSRLLTTRGATPIADQQFTYDPAGNITRILGDLPTPPPSDNTLAMAPDDANRLSTLAGAAVTNDPAGRSRSLPAPVSGTATWEGMDWLSTWTSGGQTTSYGYNGDGVRTHRTTPAGTTRYLIDPAAALRNFSGECYDATSPQRFHIHDLGPEDDVNQSKIFEPYNATNCLESLAFTRANIILNGNKNESSFTPQLRVFSNVGLVGHGIFGLQLGMNENPNDEPEIKLVNIIAECSEANTPERFHIYGLGLLASIATSNEIQTYHPNHRGDILALTNASGTVTESYGYSPFGLTVASNPASSNSFRFCGQHGVMDEGNGLHFMRARYYSATAGRFFSMDQLPGVITRAQSLNRFAYGLGNPISNIDPSGLKINFKTYEAPTKSQRKANSFIMWFFNLFF